MVKNDSKMAKNHPKQPKMTKNGPKWSKMFRKMVQMRPVMPTPNYLTQNGGKLPKNDQKWAKLP